MFSCATLENVKVLIRVHQMVQGWVVDVNDGLQLAGS